MSVTSPYMGNHPLDAKCILERALSQPFHCSSDFARAHAIGIAFAASLGWITNVTPDRLYYARKWFITAKGLSHLDFISQPSSGQQKDKTT